MPKRDHDLLLEDILEAIRKIDRYTEGMAEEDFRRDEKTEIIWQVIRRDLPQLQVRLKGLA